MLKKSLSHGSTNTISTQYIPFKLMSMHDLNSIIIISQKFAQKRVSLESNTVLKATTSR